MGEMSCPGGGGDCLRCCGGGVHRPVGCVADCVTGGGIGDCVLDGPAPGVVLGLFS